MAKAKSEDAAPDRVQRMAEEIYMLSVRAGQQTSKTPRHLAEHAHELAREFYAVADQQQEK